MCVGCLCGVYGVFTCCCVGVLKGRCVGVCGVCGVLGLEIEVEVTTLQSSTSHQKHTIQSHNTWFEKNQGSDSPRGQVLRDSSSTRKTRPHSSAHSKATRVLSKSPSEHGALSGTTGEATI